MKKTWVILLTIVILLASVSPVLAAGNGYHGKPTILTGMIIAVDSYSSSFRVKTIAGDEINIQTTEYTRFLVRVVDDVADKVSFEYLEIDQYISTRVELVNGIWTATRVTVGADLLHW